MKSFEQLCSGYKQTLRFKKESIPHDAITNLVQQARTCSAAFRLEPTHYYIVTDDSLKNSIWKACLKQPVVLDAPAIIIFTGDRFAAREQAMLLDAELENNSISVEEAEKLRQAVQFHFDTSPIGFGWLAKLIGAPFMHLFTCMPQFPAVHKREWLTRQVMRSVMTFIWAAQAHNLGTRILDVYDEWRLKWALNIPWHHVIVSVVLLGFSEEEAKIVSPLTLDDVLHWNKT